MTRNNLASERIVVSSPLSFTGSAQRLWRRTESDQAWLKAVLIPTMLVLILCVWAFVACWYCIFGLFLVPYRLLRRSQRKNKRDELRHRELLNALNQSDK